MDRWEAAEEITKYMQWTTERPISRFTGSRRFHKFGLFASRPAHLMVLFLPLMRLLIGDVIFCSAEHRTRQISNVVECSLFRHETRFILTSDSEHIHIIWRARRTRKYPSNIIERDLFGDCRVLRILGSYADLHIFQGGLIASVCYCTGILLPHVSLFRSAMNPQSLSWATILHLIVQ